MQAWAVLSSAESVGQEDAHAKQHTVYCTWCSGVASGTISSFCIFEGCELSPTLPSRPSRPSSEPPLETLILLTWRTRVCPVLEKCI